MTVVSTDEPDVIFEPDDDFYKSISFEEVRISALDHIHKLFANQWMYTINTTRYATLRTTM